MKKPLPIPKRIRLMVRLFAMAILTSIPVTAQSTTPGFQADRVPLYGAFEVVVTNDRNYRNKFDFEEIELQGEFTSPSGDTITNVYGFFDGDGSGGQKGNVWRLRFMPTETGVWFYSYTWTDGTAGGSGSFTCKESNYRGPLQVDEKKPWYFRTMDGEVFHAKPYDLHQVGPMAVSWGPSKQPAPVYEAMDWSSGMDVAHIAVMDNYMTPKGYNLTMIGSANNENYPPTYWWNDSAYVFDVGVWKATENIYLHARESGIYCFQFDGLVRIGPCEFGGSTACDTLERWNRQLIRYYVARLSSISSHFGYNPTRENFKLPRRGFTKLKMRDLMAFCRDSIPGNYKALLTIHDNMYSEFSGWQDFAIRQHPSKHLEGHSKSSQTGNNNDRGVDIDDSFAPFDFPVIGSEDVWEGLTQHGIEECIRPIWGQLLGGIIPLYSEWNRWISIQGTGVAEDAYSKSLDWWFEKIDYRNPAWMKMNDLVSSESDYDVGGGIPNEEYVAYREGNGPIVIDMSTASGSFDVSFLNPLNGTRFDHVSVVEGGASRTFDPPFGGDDVVVFVKKERDTAR